MGAKKVNINPEYLGPESQEILKERWGQAKEHRDQPKGAPPGQSWSNLNIKINKDSNGNIQY